VNSTLLNRMERAGQALVTRGAGMQKERSFTQLLGGCYLSVGCSIDYTGAIRFFYALYCIVRITHLYMSAYTLFQKAFHLRM